MKKVSSFKLNLENILVPTSCLKRKTEKVNERKKRELTMNTNRSINVKVGLYICQCAVSLLILMSL